MATVFVFGSNREGRHGKGAALTARQQYGAIYGQARGRQGNAYAIVTKELRRGVNPVTLDQVQREVEAFIHYAADHPTDTFLVTRIGCGLAGFTDAQIAPLFSFAPTNCTLPAGW
jgi:hypothetical protein